MSGTAAYAGTVNAGQVLASAANTNRDGTGTLVTVLTAGANGALLERLSVIAQGTTTAGMIRFYIDDGTNIRLLDEIEVLAVTPSGTVRAFRDEIRYDDGLPLKAGWIVKASTHNAENFAVRGFAGDF